MADQNITLHPQNDTETNLYPNIKVNNIDVTGATPGQIIGVNSSGTACEFITGGGGSGATVISGSLTEGSSSIIVTVSTEENVKLFNAIENGEENIILKLEQTGMPTGMSSYATFPLVSVYSISESEGSEIMAIFGADVQGSIGTVTGAKITETGSSASSYMWEFESQVPITNLIAGTGISITPSAEGYTIAATGGGGSSMTKIETTLSYVSGSGSTSGYYVVTATDSGITKLNNLITNNDYSFYMYMQDTSVLGANNYYILMPQLKSALSTSGGSGSPGISYNEITFTAVDGDNEYVHTVIYNDNSEVFAYEKKSIASSSEETVNPFVYLGEFLITREVSGSDVTYDWAAGQVAPSMSTIRTYLANGQTPILKLTCSFNYEIQEEEEEPRSCYYSRSAILTYCSKWYDEGDASYYHYNFKSTDSDTLESITENEGESFESNEWIITLNITTSA